MDGLKNIIITLIVCAGIAYGYTSLTSRIHLQNYGKQVEGTILEKLDEKGYTYVRFSYKIGTREFKKSIRVARDNTYKEGGRITVRYLPESPESPFINFQQSDLNRELYYTMIGVFVLGLYRIIMILIGSTRQNYD